MGLAYISVSTLLIRFNKFMMHPDRFPYAMALSALHMGFSLSLCTVFYWLAPSAFPGMEASKGKRADLLKWFVPIGLCFAASLYTSNQAYLYSNVAFLQFMKEGNVIICFLISVAAGLQVMNRVRLANILWIMAGSAMCVTHELNFVFLGFAFQLTSQFAECGRAVLGEYVLSGSSFKLDPLTYTLFAAPMCLIVLLVGNVFVWDPAILHRALQFWYYLLPNASLAFVLNLLVATIIKELSAVGFILTGLVKDMGLVVLSAIVFGEVVTLTQAVSFIVVLAGVLFWSLMKAAPNNALVRAVEDAMLLPRKSETDPILKKDNAKV